MQCNAQAGREDHKQVAGVFTRDIFQTFSGGAHDRYLSESLYEHISFQAWGYFAGGGRNRAYRFVVFRAELFCRYTSGRANCAGNADTGAGKGMAGRIFFGKRTGLYTDAASDGIAVSAGSVEAFAADSLWSDDDLWRDRKTAGKAAEPASYVCAGGRRCGGT